MALKAKLLLIILDGLPWRNWRKYMGNLEGWVQSGDARVWRMRSVLPSTSACCYASIHTGVTPQQRVPAAHRTSAQNEVPVSMGVPASRAAPGRWRSCGPPGW